MSAPAKLLLVGCGKMGGALLKPLVNQVAAVIVEPNGLPADLKATPQLQCVAAPDKIDGAFQPDIIILAAKPQQMVSVLPDYAKYKSAVFLSIAAGLPLAKLQSLLNNQSIALVRAMPNLPASIGQGMTVAVSNTNVTQEQRKLCDRILQAVGATAWLDDEQLLDAITALSGSGPAYIFALCEAMAKAGEALGLPPELSTRLARQTVIGSGALLAQSQETVETMRQAVTSPAGTTEAALKHLLADDGLFRLLQKAMRAAAERSKELASAP